MNQFDAAIAALNAEIDSETAAIKFERSALEKREQDLAIKTQAREMMLRFASDGSRPASSGPPQGAAVQAPALNEEIDLSDLVGEASTKRKTLVDDVRDVVRRFGRQEFTNAHVEAAMRRLGIEIVGKTPRSRISLAFAKLVEEGELARTFIGGGNVPHRYRVRSTMTGQELAETDAMNTVQTVMETSQATLDDQDQPSTENVVRIA